ncbi:MAG: nucleotidyltransferase domain-containing protein [Actinobacteria bacterium]|nr:nucleotidyltransferase domain-containing protein [Actinomycetota bacterium]MBU1944562.1 nucleotidyltransferase domain-containing protein [Actinomycetota bacterium]MBU2689115.1 nucleotidyltransferase domain-containing protein [Actinomycetota bacterium]
MKVNRPLDLIMNNKNKVAILRHLVLYPSEVTTGRSLARELKMNQATCNNALNSLHRAGIIMRKNAGRSSIYEIARDTAVCEELLQPLFQKEREIPGEAVRMLVQGLEAERIQAFLFGSVVRGTDTPESDTDVLLVLDDKADRKKALDRLGENTPEAYRRFRTGFNVTLLSESELARKRKRKDGFVSRAMAEAVRIEVGAEW